MASTNKTPHLGLCQWEATDPFLREDMNGDFAKIDEAIGKMSRVKLFDVTVTEAVPLIQLDFTEVDFDQFAELEMHMDIETDKNMRINGISRDIYLGRSPSSNTFSTRILIKSGTAKFDITKSDYSVRPGQMIDVYIVQRSHAPTLQQLDIYGETTDNPFKPGDHITVWGVKR